MEGISKRFGSVQAVRDLRLEVRPGEVFGFLGLNGAGKTTTIRIILDLLRPSSGRAYVLGRSCQDDGKAVRSLVGYLPGELGLPQDLRGNQVLEFLGGLSGRAICAEYRSELQERFELRDRDLNRRVRDYSTGMKRKLGLIQALQADPPLLILDEPTEGLDPVMQEAFYELIRRLRHQGRTIFMSSHVLAEVERICDRVGLLRKGELVLLSSVEAVRKMAPRTVEIEFSEDVPPPRDNLPRGVQIVSSEPRRWKIHAVDKLGDFLRYIAPLPVSDIRAAEPRLEDILIRYYGEDPA